MNDLLVRGGTVVDGTGAQSVRADVRVRDGVIAEVGSDLAADGETVVDALGAFVTPGFIEPHTHVDGAMWWDPLLDPLPGYGATTAVVGNCGLSLAPLPGRNRDRMVDLFCFLEDLPLDAFQDEIPWGWETWADYGRAAADRPTAVNIAGYVGHLALRTFVMGDNAWERTSTPHERARMAEVLDESLRAGALGLSVNLLDTDRQHRLVPSRHADDAEFAALFDVLARRRGATLQLIVDIFMETEHFVADVERMAALCGPRGVRGQWTSVSTNMDEAALAQEGLDLHGRLRTGGVDFWPLVAHKPMRPFFNFERSITFQGVRAWHELINGPHEDKARLLADPTWRAQARHDWDHRTATFARLDHPESLIFALSETGEGQLDVSLAEYAAQRGLHLSDALADWLVRNGVGSSIAGVPRALDEELAARLIRDPHTLAGANDAGAHLQLFCGAGESAYLFTRYVRDTGLLSIEEAVHALTGKLAAFFGLGDRGVIAPGLVGDLAVFALDEIEMRPEHKVWDVPGGSWRFTRPPAGFRAVAIGGTLTVADGVPTEATPGTMLGRW